MPEILVDGRDYFLRSFVRVRKRSQKRIEEASHHIGDRLLLELQSRQPRGKLDPLVMMGFSNRPARPSVRQGLVPIEEGWLPPQVRAVRGGAELSIWSRSYHIQFFTMMTGRPWLGTRHQKPIEARNYPFLWFYWRGPQMVRQSSPEGFTPESDFAKDAFDATDAFTRRETGNALRMSVVEVWKSLWTRTTQ